MELDYLPSILSVAGLVMISIVSPGPDFAIVVKNSLIYSRKTSPPDGLWHCSWNSCACSLYIAGLGPPYY